MRAWCARWSAVVLGLAAGSGAMAPLQAQDAPSSWGAARPVSAADAAAVRRAVAAQMAALSRGDGAAAYAASSASIQRRFPTAAAFMAMVEANYGPLLSATGQRFGAVTGAAATPTQGETYSQSVDVGDTDGAGTTAVFGLERDVDGTLRITSCVLIPRRPGSV